MCKEICAFILFSFFASCAFADDSQDIQAGANQYDWQTCMNEKQSDCLNDCINSEDVDCSDNCKQLSNDKCQSQGLTPN